MQGLRGTVMRYGIVMAALALAACDGEREAGYEAGFGEASAQTQAAMSGQDIAATIAGPSVGGMALDTEATVDDDAAETGIPEDYNVSEDFAQRPQRITNTNDFEAMSEHFSIEDDKERLARLQEEYQVIEAKPVPARAVAVPNIVDYALTNLNQMGVKKYRRSPFKTERKHITNCARYASADKAQEDFLALGGPKRDPKQLDPDGDGFACTWDPAPFRKAMLGN